LSILICKVALGKQ